MSITLKAESRDDLTKSEVKMKRREGKIPAVIYGKKVGSTPLLVDEKQLQAFLRTNPHAVVHLELPGGGAQPVMVSQVQRDTLSRELLHVDFHQINLDEPVRTTVALEFVGEPLGVREGGMLQTILHEVEIRCLPQHLPGTLQIDVSGLGLGDTYTVGSITPPAGIEIKSDLNAPIASVLVPQKAADEEVADRASAGDVAAAAPTSAE